MTVTLTDAGYTSRASAFRQYRHLVHHRRLYASSGDRGQGNILQVVALLFYPAPAIIKAVGMWGTPPQPTSYPAGYGFVPSAVKSAAHYTSGVASQQRRPVIPMYSGFIEIFASGPVAISNFPYWRFACSPIAGRYFFRVPGQQYSQPKFVHSLQSFWHRDAVSADGMAGVAAVYFRYRMMRSITLREKHSAGCHCGRYMYDGC